MRKTKEYLSKSDWDSLNGYFDEIVRYLNFIQEITRGFIDTESEEYVFDFKDYARINDTLTHIYNEVHFAKEVLK